MHQKPPYTIAGILHFIQHEWNKFELERHEWEVEKAELAARVALLQGEKKYNENLKRDLIRRIKMLEFCLKSEREKYNKFGQLEPVESTEKQESETNHAPIEADDIEKDSCIQTSRRELRGYLTEIGYTDAIIDKKTLRLRSLIGVLGNDEIKSSNIVRQDWLPNSTKNEQNSEFVDIGELAKLTSLDDADCVPDSQTNDGFSHKKWTPRYRLRSHYDCVRAVSFSESSPILVTASEDETIKLWHLTEPSVDSKTKQSNLPSTSNASGFETSTLDLEPWHTYRGHTAVVLSLVVHENYIYSGALNGELIKWKISFNPEKNDQYDKFDNSLIVLNFLAHKDAIWTLKLFEQPYNQAFLCSGSADNTIKIWDTSGKKEKFLVKINVDNSPTCITRIEENNAFKDVADMAVSLQNGKILLYDTKTLLTDSSTTNAQPKIVLESTETPDSTVNAIAVHPLSPYLVSAHSDCTIHIWNISTRKYFISHNLWMYI